MGVAEQQYAGLEPRECGEHRTTGLRAWCHDCTEWCYPEQPCRGCEIARLRAAVEAVDAKLTPFEGQDDFISSYVMPVGPWHKLLGLVRGS